MLIGTVPARKPVSQGFTLVELLAVIIVLAIGASMLLPALARTQPDTRAACCRNNLRQLTVAWHTWAEDHNEQLLTCDNNVTGRSNWMTGILDFTPSNLSNWDPGKDILKSPLWPYNVQMADLIKCPADLSTVLVDGQRKPRVRSVAMNDAFSRGMFLGGTLGSSPGPWLTYGKLSAIRMPARIFVFADKHPDFLSDGAFHNACTGNEPDDPPSAAKIIDFPSSLHHGAGNFSFADGHVETHKWQGSTIQPRPQYNDLLLVNVPAGDSWVDAHWLGEHTTVRY